MTSIDWLRRRLTGLVVVPLAAFFAMSLAAVPAQAAYGPPQQVFFQLRGQGSTGGTTLVGQLSGTLEFDDGNSRYRLLLVVCRQSGFVSPSLTVFVNGIKQPVIPEEGPARPDVCGTESQSWQLRAEPTFGGVIQDIRLRFRGVFFEGFTAKDIVKEAQYDNPFN
jgi:hypothetical protein